MDTSKHRFADRIDDSQTDDKVTENQIFKFNNLKIEKHKTAEENSGYGSNFKPKVTNGPSIDEVLPSQVTDQLYIYLENEEVKIEDHLQEGGKWMLFNQGDIEKLDQYWTCLKSLFYKGTLVGLKASTAFNPDSGVINCYTADAGNWVEIKKAAVAIRDVINYPFIIYYKTNVASAQGQYREKGCNSISRYMFTIKGGFYEKDKYGRWEWV